MTRAECASLLSAVGLGFVVAGILAMMLGAYTWAAGLGAVGLVLAVVVSWLEAPPKGVRVWGLGDE